MSGRVRTFDDAETAERLPYPALADTIANVLLDYIQGNAQVPDRTVVGLPNEGRLLVMPAADGEIAITKLVTAHPHNPAMGLPTIQGEVIVMQASDGHRLGILDGSVVTGRRTAALSLLAARRLAPVQDGPLLVIGAGVQARAHIEAFRAGLGTRRTFIASRSRPNAEALVAHARSLGMDATLVDDLVAAKRQAKLVVTATTSKQPVLDGRLAEDMLVCAVGAFRKDMAELSPELIGRSNVVVDMLMAAQEEAGDLIGAVRSGNWTWERASALTAFIADPEKRLDGPILFKSVGHALFDLASARLVFAS